MRGSLGPPDYLPRFIMVSDFAIIRLTEVETIKTVEFELKDFVKNIHHFEAIAGYATRTQFKEQDQVDIDAA